MSERCEVLIIGAALNGLAAALALGGRRALRPLDVIAVDAGDPALFRSDRHDGRASAITTSSRRMFETMGVWQRMAPHAEAMAGIIATDSTGAADDRPILLQFNDAEKPSAHMVENQYLTGALRDEAMESPAIRFFANSKVSAYDFGPGLAEATLADGRRIRANLIIAADGRFSRAREAAGIKLLGWAYDQSAIVTSIAHEAPHGGRAEEHFLGAGPFAVLPLPGNRSSIVWTEKTADAARIMVLDDAAFLSELSRRIGTHLGAIAVDAPRHAYPLSMYLAQSFHGQRLALIGDAAHVIHPMAGLGFNLGLRDVAALAECIADAVALGLDPGGGSVLDSYARWRRFDTVATAAATDGLNRLFSNDTAGLRALRSAALRTVNRFAMVKDVFQKQAAGTGRQPRLMMGEPV